MASSGMRDFRRFTVWQRAQRLTVAIYTASARVPSRGYPGNVTQLRRAAAAVGSNIAEGCGHSSRREFARFLQMAVASAAEVENHLELAADLRAVPRAEAERLIADTIVVRRMLAKLLGMVRHVLEGSTQSPPDG